MARLAFLGIALNRIIFVYLLDIDVIDSSRHRRFRILACVVYGGQGGVVYLLVEKAQFFGRDGLVWGIFVFEVECSEPLPVVYNLEVRLRKR